VKEPFLERLRRIWDGWQEKVCKWVIRKAVRRFDVLGHGAFMAYSWGYDEQTDYTVLAERFLDNCYVYGTQVTYYDKEGKE